MQRVFLIHSFQRLFNLEKTEPKVITRVSRIPASIVTIRHCDTKNVMLNIIFSDIVNCYATVTHTEI